MFDYITERVWVSINFTIQEGNWVLVYNRCMLNRDGNIFSVDISTGEQQKFINVADLSMPAARQN